MIVSSTRRKKICILFILPVCTFQKYDHIRLQGRPHEKEVKLFLNTKINATNVGTEKEDENMESVSILL